MHGTDNAEVESWNGCNGVKQQHNAWRQALEILFPLHTPL